MGPAFGLGSDLVPQSVRSRPPFQLQFQTLYQLRSPRQSLRSFRGSEGTRRGWDPGPRHLCLNRDLEGPGSPSEPAHQARASHPHPELRSLQLHQLQRRHRHLSCHLPLGSGGRCSSGTLFRGTSRFIRETSMRSHITTSRRSWLITDSETRFD